MKHSEAGKGGSPRPFVVDQKTFSSNWDNIDWSKKAEPEPKKEDESKEEIDENLR